MGAGGAPVRRARTGRRRRGIRIVAATIAVLAAACGGEDERPTGTVPEVFPEGASQVMVGLENYITRDGVRSAVLRADTVYTFDEESRLSLRAVALTFFQESGDTLGVMTGDSAVYELDERIVTVRGDVEARFSNGDLFEAPLLVYHAAANQVRADSGYVLTKADGTVDRGSYAIRDLESEETQKGPGEITTPEIAVPQ